MSGALLDTRGLDRLIPDWKEQGAPVYEACKEEKLYLLTEKGKYPLPCFPGVPIHNKNNYIIRLGHLVKWLGDKAEELGVEIYPGYAGAEILYDENGAVKGVATNDVGIAKDGSPKSTFERGMELHGKCTIFSEGCRGSLTKQIIQKYELETSPMSYGIGFKEIWELDPAKHRPGYVEHSLGWPLPVDQYGGSFIYHMESNGQPLAAVGFVVALDYSNPYINPYKASFKMQPKIKL